MPPDAAQGEPGSPASAWRGAGEVSVLVAAELEERIICCSVSACAAISSAVDDSSSAAEALRCVTWSTCSSPGSSASRSTACSRDAAATSCTSSAVFWMDGTSCSEQPPERSADLHARVASSLISLAALWLRSASLRTSVATTAKPFPCSPARAASIAAFSASRFVW